MEFAGYEIAWQSTEGKRLEVRREGLGGFDGSTLSLELSFDGELLRAVVDAHETVRIERFRVLLRHEFTPGERCLLNGWQSWTATDWVAPDAREWGLNRVPRWLVSHYVLDGSGDYRFCRYDARPGHLHGWTWAEIRTVPHVDDEWLVASADESHGFTLVQMDAHAETITLETEVPAGQMPAGSSRKLGSYVLLQGTRERVFDRWFELMGVKARHIAPLAGYSSWYRHYGDIDEPKLLHDLESERGAFRDLDLGTCIPVFQIDDGWAKVGDWLEPDPERFPDGMAELAQSIADEEQNQDSSLSLLPGIWLAPFVCERDSRLFHQHPSWLLRDELGRPVSTGSHWSGAYALDTRNPGVRAYVRNVIRTVTLGWGYRFLKLDFLYAACMLPHDGMNRGELMADAIDLLRDAAGEEVLLDGCGVPLASAFGKLDYCRIGCDVGLDWDGAPPMRLLERERVSTRHSLACTRARAMLDGRAFGCDPDVFFLRDDVRLSSSQKNLLLDVDARCASMLLSSDDMGDWDQAKRALFQQGLGRISSRKDWQ